MLFVFKLDKVNFFSKKIIKKKIILISYLYLYIVFINLTFFFLVFTINIEKYIKI